MIPNSLILLIILFGMVMAYVCAGSKISFGKPLYNPSCFDCNANQEDTDAQDRNKQFSPAGQKAEQGKQGDLVASRFIVDLKVLCFSGGSEHDPPGGG